MMSTTPTPDSGVGFDADELRRLTEMFERSPSFVCVLDGPEHHFVMVNPAYQRLMGQRDFIGLTVREAIPDVAGQGFFEVLDEVFTTGETFSGQNIPLVVQQSPNAAPETRMMDFFYQPIRNAAGVINAIYVEGVDITYRKAAQQALDQSEARLEDLRVNIEREVNARTKTRNLTWTLSSDLLGVLNAEGYFETANPAWKSVLGWEEAEVLKMSIFELLHPEDVAVTRAGFDLNLIGQPVSRFVNRYLCKDGSYRWISWEGIPEDGHIYCTGRDITAERTAEAELAAAQEILRQTAKMETIGQLSGGIAHDFNNHLASILGALDLSRRRIEAGRIEDLNALIAAASDSAHKAAILTHRLLSFARRQPLVVEPNNLNQLIRNMEDLLQRSLPENIRMEFFVAPDLWTVLCDGNQLENVLLNIVINSRDAMPDGGMVRIQTRNISVDATASSFDTLKHGDYVVLSVTDNGIGMTPERAAKAAEPFFTTKPVGAAVGLGLAIVQSFAKQSGGQMQIHSEPGRGTTIQLYLPRAHHPAIMPESPKAEAPLGKGETILLVEDDSSVRVIVTEILTDLGYNVQVYADPRMAILHLQTEQKVDLLVSDVVMPHISGPKLAEVGRGLRPGLKVLFITGYADMATAATKFVGNDIDLLLKPFTVDSLGVKIRLLLDAQNMTKD